VLDGRAYLTRPRLNALGGRRVSRASIRLLTRCPRRCSPYPWLRLHKDEVTKMKSAANDAQLEEGQYEVTSPIV
jgi:hypothetical protein